MLAQNQNETGVFDLLRLLLTFGADCRLKDAHGNNGTTPAETLCAFLSACLTMCSLRIIYLVLLVFLISSVMLVHSILLVHSTSVVTPFLFIFKKVLENIPLASLASVLHCVPLLLAAFHLIAAVSQGFTDTKFAHLITEKAQRDNRNISDALFTSKNHLKQVPYMVSE